MLQTLEMRRKYRLKEIVSGTHSVIAFNIEAQFFSRLSLYYFSIDAKAYSGLSQISTMELFAKIRNDLMPPSIFLNSSISYDSEVCLSRAIFYKIDW